MLTLLFEVIVVIARFVVVIKRMGIIVFTNRLPYF